MRIYKRNRITASTQSDLENAKEYINEFCQDSYGVNADFSNLSKVSLAYTTDEDTDDELQVYADLKRFRIVYERNRKIINEEQYSSLSDMNQNALSVLDFDELLSMENIW